MIDINYGSEVLALDFPEDGILFRAAPAKHGDSPDLDRMVRESLAGPIDSALLSELARGKKDICIICDDLTRTTPADRMLPFVLEELTKAGVTESHITIVIALGSHRGLNEAEIEQKIGRDMARRFTVLNHDHKSRENLVTIQSPGASFDIQVNRKVAECDCRICIGTIIPHFPSGWSGGAKMMLPGVAGLKTIAQMHYLGATDPKIKLGTIPNPCRDLMETFAEQVGLDYVINIVPDTDGNVVAVVSGHFVGAHRAGVDIAGRTLSAHVPARADAVLASAFPSDMDLLQAGKALFAAERCVAQGGEVILLSPCDEGVGPSHPDIADYCTHSQEELIAGIDEERWDNPLRAAFAIGLKRMSATADISVFSEGLPISELAKIGYGHIGSRDQLADKMASLAGSGKRLGILDHATKVLPVVAGDL